MKKLFLLIVSLFFLCISCEQEEHGSEPAQLDHYIFISNISTNNYLMYYTNSRYGRDDRGSYTRSGITYLTNGDYFQFFVNRHSSDWDIDIVLNEINKIVTIKFYDPETTNFLFKITNCIPLLKTPTNHAKGIFTNLYGIPHVMVINDSTFTNTYYGTTNE